MKNKSLFIIALLSLFSLSAFAVAVTDTCYVEVDYPSDSIYYQGDTVNFTFTCSNPSAITDTVAIRLLTGLWGTTDQNIGLSAPIPATLDTFVVIPADAKLKDCPNVGDNAFSNMIQVGIGADVAWNENPVKLIVAKKDGQECPVEIQKMTDIFNVEMKILRTEGDTITRGMAQWIGWGTNPSPGDILWVTGTYEPEVGGVKATEVYLNVSYFYDVNDAGVETEGWGASHTLQRHVHASTAQGNLDGNIDMKVMVPYYLDTKFLSADGSDLDYNELAQVRVVYEEKLTYEAMNGNIVEDSPYMNWWGALHMYDGDMPALGANVSGIEVSNIKDRSVVLSWDLASDATWDIVIAPKGEVRNPDQAEFTTTGGIKTTIAGLEPGTDYELFVRSVSNPDTTNASVNREVGAYNAEAIEFTTTGTASLRSVNVNNNVSIYPNPTTGIITISADKAYAVTVCDLAGRAIMRKSMTSASQELDLSDINNGIYLLQFNDGEQSFAKKFMKQ